MREIKITEKLKRDFYLLINKIEDIPLKEIKTKLNNLCGKTGKYDVPNELFQKRTSRSGRVLLRWKLINENKITYEQLKSFKGGVYICFTNSDYFDIIYDKDDYANDNPSYKNLITKLPQKIDENENISAMVGFFSEDGCSGSSDVKVNYNRFINIQTPALKKCFKDGKVSSEYLIQRKNDAKRHNINKGNNKITGFLFYSIKGGDQNSIESSNDIKAKNNDKDCLKIFNPAIEYADEDTMNDITLTMMYFLLHCKELKQNDNIEIILQDFREYLKTRIYFNENLLDYCDNHPSLRNNEKILKDVIRDIPIELKFFSDTTESINRLVLAHDESANKCLFHYDISSEKLLSPARPTNFFWSTAESNMIQQNYTLKEYIKIETVRVLNRLLSSCDEGQKKVIEEMISKNKEFG